MASGLNCEVDVADWITAAQIATEAYARNPMLEEGKAVVAIKAGRRYYFIKNKDSFTVREA